MKYSGMLALFLCCDLQSALAKEIHVDFSREKKRNFYFNPVRVNLTKIDKLRITMPVPHGEYLVIQSISPRVYFFLISPFSDRSLVNHKKFRETKTYTLPDSVRSDDGEIVFTHPGIYRLIVGNELETDRPNYEYVAEINYKYE